MKIRLFLVIMLTYASSCFCQIDGHKWVKPKFNKTIPEEYANEDAVMLLNKTSVYIDFYGGGNSMTRKTKFIRIKLQSEKGVEQFAKVFLEKPRNYKITKLDARTIKPNNKTIDLDKNEIFTLGFSDIENNRQRSEEVRFAIPGVEVGDIIEITYSLELDRFLRGEDVFLFESIPCLRSEYKLVTPPELIIESRAYNSSLPVEREKFTDKVQYKFMTKNTPGLGDQQNSIPFIDLPYNVWATRGYKREYKSTIQFNENSWNSFYNLYAEAFNNGKTEKSSEEGAYAKMIKEAKTKSGTVERLNHVIQELKKLKLVNEDLKYQDLNQYIEAGVIDSWTCHYFLLQAMKRLGLKSYVCFGRNKYEGLLDVEFVSTHQLRHVFYAFEDGNGIRFLYPSYLGQYMEVDEVPWQLMNTSVVLLPTQGGRVNLDQAFVVNVPLDSAKDCFQRDARSIDIDINTGLAKQSMKRTVSGAFSTSRRPQMINMIEEDWILEDEEFEEFEAVIASVDSLGTLYPFQSSFNYEYEQILEVESLEDTLVSLNIEPLIHVEKREPKSEIKRLIDYHSPYPYQHQVSMEIEFNSAVNLIESINEGFSNNYGRFQMQVLQSSESTLKCNILYVINTTVLPSNEFHLIKELNDKVEELVKSEIILSTQ